MQKNLGNTIFQAKNLFAGSWHRYIYITGTEQPYSYQRIYRRKQHKDRGQFTRTLPAPRRGWKAGLHKRASLISQLLEGANAYKMMCLLKTEFKLKERKKRKASICSLPLLKIGKRKRIYQIRDF